jgi:flagellar biogenesis protein FliO
MLLVLAIIIVALLYIKKYIESRDLFKNRSEGITIKSIKMIDTKNKIALASYRDRDYLLLLGESNLVIDSFDCDNSFDKSLEEAIDEDSNNS